MSTRFAINGVGRIGRALIRTAGQRPDLELVALNDLAPVDQIAHLLSRDTLHGRFTQDLRVEGSKLILNGHEISTYRQPSLDQIPWLDDEPHIV
ncbi:MAG: glyceraldehyde 3-phosphate dehydrogenase NAD-binding domain-containing protein, partial [Acidobacteriota bacterium]